MSLTKYDLQHIEEGSKKAVWHIQGTGLAENLRRYTKSWTITKQK